MTLDQLCRQMRQRLAPLYPQGEAAMLVRIIWEHLKDWNQTELLIRASEPVSDFMQSKAEAIIDRLLTGEPIQYILGEARFYGMKLRVDRSTLIPRPETEQLVDDIVDDAAETTDLRVLDLCTGSGCIAIALARNLRFACVEGVDVSVDAIAVAADNAKSLHADVLWRCADVLEMRPKPDTFDIIVSNPPYIAEKERAGMSATVKDYEPRQALFVPDNDPLLFYRAISRFAMTAFKAGGRLYFEINPLYAAPLRSMMEQHGWQDVVLGVDSQKLTRYLKARKPL